MPDFSFASLRVRLILLVLLAVLPALKLTLWNAEQARQREAARVQEDAQRLTRLTASNVEQFVEGARQLLVAISRLSRVRDHDVAGCDAVLADLLKQYPHPPASPLPSPDAQVPSGEGRGWGWVRQRRHPCRLKPSCSSKTTPTTRRSLCARSRRTTS